MFTSRKDEEDEADNGPGTFLTLNKLINQFGSFQPFHYSSCSVVIQLTLILAGRHVFF